MINCMKGGDCHYDTYEKILCNMSTRMGESIIIDVEHQITAAEIITRLNAEGMTADRKTIYKDIEILQSHGVDIASRLLTNSLTGFCIRRFSPVQKRWRHTKGLISVKRMPSSGKQTILRRQFLCLRHWLNVHFTNHGAKKAMSSRNSQKLLRFLWKQCEFA